MKTNRTNPTRTEAGNLLKSYESPLKAFVYKRIQNKVEAEDIVQDVFYQFLKTLEDAMNPIEHVSAWLYKVARNTIINKSKKKQEEELPEYSDFEELLFGDQAAPSPELEYLRSLVWIELDRALSELPTEQREVFERNEFDGLSVKEIARQNNLSINTVLSRKHYAVLHLRKRLGALYKDLIQF